MSSSSDFNMLRLEAPRDLLQITFGTDLTEATIDIPRPASWVRALVHPEEQAENDLRQLYDACGQEVDRTDRRIREIERAYLSLYNGTRYVYETAQSQAEIAEGWIRGELAVAANAYQTFTRQV
jgi:hypothetical protein